MRARWWLVIAGLFSSPAWGNPPRASTTLEPQGRARYDPALAADGRRATAWCEAAAGDGVGEWIELSLGDASALGAGTIAVAVQAGYQKSEEAFAKNGRPTRVLLALLQGARTVDQAHADCDARGACAAALRVRGASGPIDLRLTIEKVAPGPSHDTCVSELAPRLPVQAAPGAGDAAASFCRALIQRDAAAMRAFTDEPLATLRAAFSPETGESPRPACNPASLAVRAADLFDLFQVEYGSGSATRRFQRLPLPDGPRWRALDARVNDAW